MLERGVLHLRRKRMLDWITENAEPNCGIDSFFQIRQRVTAPCYARLLFHVEVVAAPLSRGEPEHGDRVPWLHDRALLLRIEFGQHPIETFQHAFFAHYFE